MKAWAVKNQRRGVEALSERDPLRARKRRRAHALSAPRTDQHRNVPPVRRELRREAPPADRLRSLTGRSAGAPTAR